ncbi:hypothetical protein B0T19DRAFT_181772 [Cercophora scortea]|uniref:Uncharacterized protein n=1 Tax=Cercophora scortea TaxID=314031 RepID=A0AAE0MDU1_9PEZI|nr:hypothetical protein B0T19DRAFT_181772 [Cercophora scortea]
MSLSNWSCTTGSSPLLKYRCKESSAMLPAPLGAVAVRGCTTPSIPPPPICDGWVLRRGSVKLLSTIADLIPTWAIVALPIFLPPLVVVGINMPTSLLDPLFLVLTYIDYKIYTISAGGTFWNFKSHLRT